MKYISFNEIIEIEIKRYKSLHKINDLVAGYLGASSHDYGKYINLLVTIHSVLNAMFHYQSFL
jgi:hypothetical protein